MVEITLRCEGALVVRRKDVLLSSGTRSVEIAENLTMSDLTLSIVSHGHGALLRTLLRDLNQIASLRGASVIITLNVPEERIDHASYPNLRVDLVENPIPMGFSTNHNAAFRRCNSEWFAILNPDLHVTDDVFTRLLATVRRSPRIALVAPVVTDATGAVEDSVRANLTPFAVFRRVFGARRKVPEPTESHEFRWFAGMCLLLRSSAFRAVGGFDERYFLYCEDYDLCARLHLTGYELKLDPTSTVVHEARRSSHSSLRHFRWHLCSLLRVWSSYPVWKIAIGADRGSKSQG